MTHINNSTQTQVTMGNYQFAWHSQRRGQDTHPSEDGIVIKAQMCSLWTGAKDKRIFWKKCAKNVKNISILLKEMQF